MRFCITVECSHLDLCASPCVILWEHFRIRIPVQSIPVCVCVCVWWNFYSEGQSQNYSCKNVTWWSLLWNVILMQGNNVQAFLQGNPVHKHTDSGSETSRWSECEYCRWVNQLRFPFNSLNQSHLFHQVSQKGFASRSGSQRVPTQEDPLRGSSFTYWRHSDKSQGEALEEKASGEDEPKKSQQNPCVTLKRGEISHCTESNPPGVQSKGEVQTCASNSVLLDIVV